MTPLQIEIMLHYYSNPNDYRPNWRDPGEEMPPAVADALHFLDRAGMLTCNGDPTSEPPVFTITDKGRAYVDKLKSIPMPVEKVTWGFPETPPALQDMESFYGSRDAMRQAGIRFEASRFKD